MATGVCGPCRKWEKVSCRGSIKAETRLPWAAVPTNVGKHESTDRDSRLVRDEMDGRGTNCVDGKMPAGNVWCGGE